MDNDILKSIEADFKKAQTESVKAKAKDIRRKPRRKRLFGCATSLKLKKLFKDFEAGIL